MIDEYKNREITYQKYKSPLNALTESERNEYLNSGCITVHELNPLRCEKRVEEKFTSRIEVNKFNLVYH